MSTRAPIYLDNAATTRPLESVVRAMEQAHLDWFGNPSSAHQFASEPRKMLRDAREFLRGTLAAHELIFTSGGTEADLLGITGAVHRRSPGRVLCAAGDHPAILAQSEALARSRHKLVPLPTTADGDIDPEVFFEHLGADVRGIALMHGHNELGTLCDIEELVSLARRVCPGAHIHVDLVQSYGKIPFDLNTVDVDSVAVSGHKLHGPRGIGFLAYSSTAEIHPLQPAGGQEHGLRGGTENLAGAVGLATAAEAAFTHLAHTTDHTEDLAELLFSRVLEAFPDSERLGNPDHHLPHILSMRIPGVVGGRMLERLDKQGIAFSTGSACHAGEDKPNPVHQAIGLSRQESREVMRFSFSRDNTWEEVETVADLLIDEAHVLQNEPEPPRPKKAKGKPQRKARPRRGRHRPGHVEGQAQ